MIGVIKLTKNVKYFPFHVKIFQLLTLINKQTNDFIPIAQYLLYPFDLQASNYLNQKSKALEDKIMPETLVSLKIAKKHIDTSEMKDRIVQEALDELLLYYAANSRQIGFPEMVIGTQIILKKFKKSTKSSSYRQLVQTFLDHLDKHSQAVLAKRISIKMKLASENLPRIA